MPSPVFLQRLERVLSNRVEDKQRQTSRGLDRGLRGLGVVVGTLACFFVLKGAALSQGALTTTPPSAEAGIGAQVAFWMAGADPVSSTLAAALRGTPDTL